LAKMKTATPTARFRNGGFQLPQSILIQAEF